MIYLDLHYFTSINVKDKKTSQASFTYSEYCLFYFNLELVALKILNGHMYHLINKQTNRKTKHF